MTAYKKLFIDLKSEDTCCVISEIEKNLSNGWSRDFMSEKKYLLDSKFKQYCFKLDTGDDEFLMWLSLQDGDLTTTNITPTDYHSIGLGEYNEVLNHFINSVLKNKSMGQSLKNYYEWYTMTMEEGGSFTFANDDSLH